MWKIVLMRTVQANSCIRNRGITSRCGHIQSSFTVRHVACTLLYCCEWENPTEGSIRKQILVSFHAKPPIVLERCGVFSVFTDGQQNRENLVGLQKCPKRRCLSTSCCQSKQNKNVIIPQRIEKKMFSIFFSSPEPGNSLQ